MLVTESRMNTTSVSPSELLPAYTSIDSPFQMAEYLASLIKRDPKDVETIVDLPESGTGPGNSSGGSQVGTKEQDRVKGDVNGDRGGQGKESPESGSANKKEVDLWVYEHLRRLPLDLTPLLTSLLPICTRKTCPEMKAAEWVYLCVAHPVPPGGTSQGYERPQGCAAIDYILHTVDQHTALWNSTQAFPSRLSIKAGSERYFGQQARRISRVFGHAWFHHREVFEVCEAENALYARFLALIRRYGLMAESLLVIPWDEPKGQEDHDVAEPRSDDKIEVEVGGEKQKDKDGELRNGHEQGNAAGLKRSSTIKPAGRKSEDEQDADVEDVLDGDGDDDDDEGDFRRDAPSTAVKRGISNGKGLGSIGRTGRGKSIRGKRRLFHVDIPNEEDEDRDDVSSSKSLHRDEEDDNGKGVAKFATPTLKDPLAGDPSVGVPVPAGDSSESDEESDGSGGGSDPDEAVNPDKGSVNSDDEDESMVEDVGAGSER